MAFFVAFRFDRLQEVTSGSTTMCCRAARHIRRCCGVLHHCALRRLFTLASLFVFVSTCFPTAEDANKQAPLVGAAFANPVRAWRLRSRARREQNKLKAASKTRGMPGFQPKALSAWQRHRGFVAKCCTAALAVWYSFDFVVLFLARLPLNSSASSAVSRALSGVILPIMGFAFAVFMERGASDLTDRIDKIEYLLNREASILSVLVPKLDALLEGFPQERHDAFTYLESHVARLLGLLKEGESWRRDKAGLKMLDLGEELITAVSSVDRQLAHRKSVSSAKIEQLRCANDWLMDWSEVCSQRITAEQMALPWFFWITLTCFSVTFCFGFLVAVIGDRDGQCINELNSSTSDSPVRRRSMTAAQLRYTLDSKRLRAMWAMLILLIFLIADMSIDMQNPYAGQYSIDDYGVLAAVFEGPIRSPTKSRECHSCIYAQARTIDLGIRASIHWFTRHLVLVGAMRLLRCLSTVLTASVLLVRADPLQLTMYFDPLCRDCHAWMLYQLLPLWRDAEFGPLFDTAVKVDLLALFAFNTEEDRSLVRAFNCARQELEPHEFIEMAFCAEGTMHSKAQRANVIDKCVQNADKKDQIQSCANDRSKSRAFQHELIASSPAEFHKVPWIGVDNQLERLAYTDLKAVLCSRLSEGDRPSSCPQAVVEKRSGEEVGCGMGGTICLENVPEEKKGLRVKRQTPQQQISTDMPLCDEMVEGHE